MNGDGFSRLGVVGAGVGEDRQRRSGMVLSGGMDDGRRGGMENSAVSYMGDGL